jgi:ketosteroid isomerase-like protein
MLAALRLKGGLALAEHPNVAKIRRGLELRKVAQPTEEDFAFLYDLFDEDVVWHGGGTSQMFAEGTHGRDAVFAQFGKIEGAGTFERELKHVLADEYHAVALVHNDVHKGDTHMQWYEMMVFHLNPEGRIIEFWGLHEDPDAVDRLWAEPASA